MYDGERLVGTVDGIEDIPGNPCLIIGDALVPLHEDLVVSADHASRTIVLSLPAGLFEN